MNLSNTTKFAAQQKAIRSMTPEAFTDLKEAYYKTAEGLLRLRQSSAVLTPEQCAALTQMEAAFGNPHMRWLGQIL